MKTWNLVVLFISTLTLTAQGAMQVSPFELPMANGKSANELFKSSDHPNTVYVIENYFYGCPYCRENAENVNELADAYKNDPRVVVLDVGIDKMDSLYEAWVKKFEPNHPVLKDPKRVIAKQLKVTGYPTAVILDQNLNVVFRTTGVWEESTIAEMMRKIDSLLAQ